MSLIMATAQEAHHGDRSGQDDRSGRRQRNEFEVLLAEVLVLSMSCAVRLCGKKQLQVSTDVTGASRTNCHGFSMLAM